MNIFNGIFIPCETYVVEVSKKFAIRSFQSQVLKPNINLDYYKSSELHVIHYEIPQPSLH